MKRRQSPQKSPPNASNIHFSLRLELESEHVEWFPARLRHILDNIFSNAVKSRDSGGGTVTIESGEGQGTTVTFALPH